MNIVFHVGRKIGITHTSSKAQVCEFMGKLYNRNPRSPQSSIRVGLHKADHFHVERESEYRTGRSVGTARSNALCVVISARFPAQDGPSVDLSESIFSCAAVDRMCMWIVCLPTSDGWNSHANTALHLMASNDGIEFDIFVPHARYKVKRKEGETEKIIHQESKHHEALMRLIGMLYTANVSNLQEEVEEKKLTPMFQALPNHALRWARGVQEDGSKSRSRVFGSGEIPEIHWKEHGRYNMERIYTEFNRLSVDIATAVPEAHPIPQSPSHHPSRSPSQRTLHSTSRFTSQSPSRHQR